MESIKELSNNLVEFRFTRNFYPKTEKLYVYFNIPNMNAYQPESGDWIGIFKVGWSSLREYNIRKHITSDIIERSKKASIDYGHVVFEHSDLPNDNTSYFQFVYVTKKEAIRGASKPFQFELPTLATTDDELLTRDQYDSSNTDSGLRSIQSSSLNGGLLSIEKELIQQQQSSKENSRDNLVSRLLQKYIQTLKLNEKDVELSKKLEDLFQENVRLGASLGSKNQEIAALKRNFHEVKNSNQFLNQKLSHAERRIEHLQNFQVQQSERINSQSGDSLNKYTVLEKTINDLADSNNLLQEENEKLQEELKQLNRFLERERENVSELRHKLYRSNESVLDEITRKSQLEQMLSLETGDDRNNYETKVLKRLVEELKTENEALRERIRGQDGLQPSEKQELASSLKSIFKNSMQTSIAPKSAAWMRVRQASLDDDDNEASIITLSSSTTSNEIKHSQPQQPEITAKILLKSRSIGKSADDNELINIKSTSVIPTWAVKVGDTQSRPLQTLWERVDEKQRIKRKQEKQGLKQDSQVKSQMVEQVSQLVDQIENEQIKQKSIEKLNKVLHRAKENLLEIKRATQIFDAEKQRQAYEDQWQEAKQQQKQQQIEEQKWRQQQHLAEEQKWSLQPEDLRRSSLREQTIAEQLLEEQQQQRQHSSRLYASLSQQALNNLNGAPFKQSNVAICPVCGVAVHKELNSNEFELHVNSHFTD